MLQAYIIMENTFRKMGEVFDEIAQTEDQPPLVLWRKHEHWLSNTCLHPMSIYLCCIWYEKITVQIIL